MSDIIGLFLLGLLYGATICSISCLPYLGPYLLSTGKGFKDGIFSTFTFLTGKLVVYATLGGCAAFLGNVWMFHEEMPVGYIMGIVLIIVGLFLPFVAGGGCHKKARLMGKSASLFLLGISTSLIPCPPLVAIFALAAKEGSIISGVSYGLSYGLGLTLSPVLIAGGCLSLISKKIKLEALGFIPYMQGLSVLIIVIMGIRLLIQEV
ncbi:MAG: sulfite exporter TauE/SafE family protein [Pseudomonadota bacterium]